MRSALLKAALGMGVAVGIVTTAAADPALFVARDADTRVYLFGTVHLANCDTVEPAPTRPTKQAIATGCPEWLTGAIADAFAEADELWIETVDLEDEALIVALTEELGFLPEGERLTDYVPAAELLELAELLGGGAMADALVPEFDRMTPWLLSTVLGTLTMTGGDPTAAEQGVDMVLMRLAAERGIPVNGFETGEYQIRMIAGDPMELQVADLRTLVVLLRAGIDLAALVEWTFDKMWEFWLAGDLESVAYMMLGDDEAFFDQYEEELAPILGLTEADIGTLEDAIEALYEGQLADPVQRALDGYERVIAERNRNWAVQIDTMFDRPGTFFVAVGAGHFTGDAALQTLITGKGVTVERIQ
ncbi:MAG: TraB/GumN family protein [Bauldia sp.]|nr:TraB/GumN family protein [Bauldia sp.]